MIFCMKKKVVLSLSILMILGSIIAIGNKPVHNLIEYDENTTLALFNENGEKIDQVPSRDSGYTLDTEKSSCTNGSVSWDIESWSPVVTVNSEVNGRVSCNLYFKKATSYDLCVAKYGSHSIQCGIIADLDDTGICPTVNADGTIYTRGEEQFSGYLCSAPDDYGTSYYYRGNVDNNYVYFAGYYWRIIRINGDGSIRLIYDGTSVHVNGESSTDRQIGTSAYNLSYNDNAYVGYMYGTAGSSTYEDTHANTNDSAMKTYLDNWYETNLLGTEYESYIADALFCNDRSFNSTNSGTGAGTSTTYYRWYGNSSTNEIKLMCSQQNDRFTVSDDIMGNEDLMYAIGLITTDELVLAGGHGDYNLGYYLYTGNRYWTMTPISFTSYADIRAVDSDGNAYSDAPAYGVSGVRPVINLKANSLKSGDGTASSPYTVEG